MKKVKVSCLIPFYNEGIRLYSILEVVTKIKSIDQIVCVDDGSDDDTSRIIKMRWPQLDVIKLNENRGKSAAVKEGLHYVKHENVLLLDADLQDIKQNELECAILSMKDHPEVDMLILRRVNAAWFVKIERADILLSGERILKKQDLVNILKNEVKGYQLEVAINTYMQYRKKTVQWMSWSATNTYKMQKIGMVKGAIKEIRMFVSIFTYAGLSVYARQLTSFARKELQWNYNERRQAS